MTPTDAPLFPPGRYGHRREPRRRPRAVPVALAAVAVLALLALAWRLYDRYGSNPYQPGVVRYGEVTDARVTVTFDVSKPAGGTGVCRLQAQDASGAETGYAEVTVAGGAHVTMTYTIPTKKRAVLVTILGCNAVPR